MSLDSGFQPSLEKQTSPAGAGAELCIAVKFKSLCLPLHTRSDELSAGSVYISGSVFTVPASVRACMASFASALLIPSWIASSWFWIVSSKFWIIFSLHCAKTPPCLCTTAGSVREVCSGRKPWGKAILNFPFRRDRQHPRIPAPLPCMLRASVVRG